MSETRGFIFPLSSGQYLTEVLTCVYIFLHRAGKEENRDFQTFGPIGAQMGHYGQRKGAPPYVEPLAAALRPEETPLQQDAAPSPVQRRGQRECRVRRKNGRRHAARRRQLTAVQLAAASAEPHQQASPLHRRRVIPGAVRELGVLQLVSHRHSADRATAVLR